MMKITVLLVAVWLHLGTSRRLRESISNDIETGANSLNFDRPKDWVRISHAPQRVVTAPVGSRVEIECECIGSPAPTVQWLKDGTPITEDESYESNLLAELPTAGIARVRSRLVIPAVLSVHAAHYTCVAESGSQFDTAPSQLAVARGVPERNLTQLLADNILGARQPPRVVLHYSSYMDVIGNDVVLPCKTVGSPPPNVVWLDNHEQVVDDERATVQSDGSLRLRNIQWSDMGKYVCIARNGVDRDHVQTFLYPMLPDK